MVEMIYSASAQQITPNTYPNTFKLKTNNFSKNSHFLGEEFSCQQ
jgi:hypothetical protein